VAVLHGAPEVQEPARLSPPVADFLLAKELGWLERWSNSVWWLRAWADVTSPRM
jgi:hypothetical protein